MSTSDPYAPVRRPKPVVIGVVVLLLVVVIAGVIAVVATRGGDDPSSATGGTPRDTAGPDQPGAVSDDDYQAALDKVVSLQQISADDGSSWVALVDVFKNQVQNPTDTAGLAGAETVYQTYLGDTTTYQSTVESIGSEPALADAEVSAAYDAFKPQALGTIEYEQSAVALYGSCALCNQTLHLSLLGDARTAHQQSADRCIAAVQPLLASPHADLVAYATAMDTLMAKRKKIYRALNSIEKLAGPLGAAAGGKLAAAYDEFFPTLKKLTTDGGLQQIADASSVTPSYPALLALLKKKAGTA